MKWLVEGTDGIERQIEPTTWEITLSSSREIFTPNTASISLPRNAPVKNHDWVRAVDGGKTEFLGYVSRSPSIAPNGMKKLSLLGVESLLMNCPCPKQTYWSGVVYLSQIFGHADPDTSINAYDIPGLIFAANSQIPGGIREDTLPSETTDDWISHGPAEIVDYDNGIVRYPNMGTRSRIGPAAIFVDGYPYADKSSYALMAGGNVAVYRDADDLYLRHWRSGAPVLGWPNASLFAKNAYDTRCRFGGIDNDSALEIKLFVDPTITINKVLFNLATAFDQYLYFKYIDKLCYVYVKEDFEDFPTISISSDECNYIDYIEPTDQEPDAIIGGGHGGNNTRQMQSIFKCSPGTAFVRDVSQFPYTFFNKNQTLLQATGASSSYPFTLYELVYFTPTTHHGMLFERTLAKWRETRAKTIVRISHRHAPTIDSYVNFSDGENDLLQVATLQKSSDKDNIITLGKSVKTINDKIQAAKEIFNSVTKNDFGIVSEITDTVNMVGAFATGEDTKYITQYNIERLGWGTPGDYPEGSADIVSYDLQYYKDNNIRFLLSFKMAFPQKYYASKGPFEHGKCFLLIECNNQHAFWQGFMHHEAFLDFNPLEEEIVDWDVTQYIMLGSEPVISNYSFQIIVASTDYINCYLAHPACYDESHTNIMCTAKLKLVQLGYTAACHTVSGLRIKRTGLLGITWR